MRAQYTAMRTRKWRRQSKVLLALLVVVTMFYFLLSGPHDIRSLQVCVTFANCTREVPFRHFTYPLYGDMNKMVAEFRQNPRNASPPIFPYPFRTIVSPKCKCGCPEAVFSNDNSISKDILLFLVKSAPDHFEKRQAIRHMWGDENLEETKHLSLQVRIVFLLALPKNKNVTDKLNTEIQSTKDIVQLSYLDSYYNNTYKTIGGLTWAVQNCSRAKFLMFLDDDFYVNPVLAIQHLETIKLDDLGHLFLGKVWQDNPQRNSDKWSIPVAVYPFNRYPPFISAGCMIMSMEFAINLRIAAMYTRKFKFDDVFLAIVAYKLGVTPQHSNFIRISKGFSYKEKDFHQVIAAHRYHKAEDLLEAWKMFKWFYKKNTNFKQL